MLTALYPFVHSECEDLEMLLSVRSLKRLAKLIEGVLIVGDKPKCWDELVKIAAVEHLPHKSATKVSPVKDVLAKTLAACGRIQGDALFLHDDMLVLQDNAVLRHEHRGKLVVGRGYWGAVTRNTLTSLGFKTEQWNYECHTPIAMNMPMFAKAFAEPSNKDRLMKSLYLNSPGVREYHTAQGIPVVTGANRKMRVSETFNKAMIDRYRAQTTFLSMHHTVSLDELQTALADGFV